MKLVEALQAARSAEEGEGEGRRVFLAVGFEPLHLRTFLLAKLGQRLTVRPLAVDCGYYGSLVDNIARAAAEGYEDIIVQLEWDDLDPRLGWRALGGWSPALYDDIVGTVERGCARLAEVLRSASENATVVLSGPHLRPAPLFLGNPELLSSEHARLRMAVNALYAELGQRIRVVDGDCLAGDPDQRADHKSIVTSGYPYGMPFTSTLADALASALLPGPVKKAVITDLDNTLWRGIVGDDGVDAIAWSLDDRALVHGLYQQMLNALMDLGILVGVASKNDPDVVEEAFARDDLLFRHAEAFPQEIGWHPKSESVRRMLEVWNIGADSVVFIDDNEAELAEVQTAFPEIECLLFRPGDPDDVVALLRHLRRSFAKTKLNEEDGLRARSIRQNAEMREAAVNNVHSQEAFLSGLEGRIAFNWQPSLEEKRPFELVNKTNQMNLNGERIEWPEWQALLRRNDSTVLVVEYADRFGALGRISVVAGIQSDADTLDIEHWVMSCRAFSRRIEHATIAALFARTGSRYIRFDYRPTKRNGPMQSFLAEFCDLPAEAKAIVLSRADFEERCPTLYAEVNHDGQ